MKAKDTFHQEPWKHNCAQAVAYKWITLYSDPDVVEKYASQGGGRAPEGLCGALYAATQACPEHAQEIIAEFSSFCCGAIHCHDIKGKGHTPCPTCVDIADSLLTKYTSPKS